MKNFIFFLTTYSLLFSCSPSPEKIQEDINKKYLDQAQTYIQSKIDKANKDEDVTIDSFSNLEIDSTIILSSQMVERIKMQPLWKKYNLEKEYFDELLEIDKRFGTAPDKMTIASRDKCQEIIDSLQRWENRANSLSQKDTIGFAVQFEYDLKQSDGVSLKNRQYIIYFDKNHDINGDWND